MQREGEKASPAPSLVVRRMCDSEGDDDDGEKEANRWHVPLSALAAGIDGCARSACAGAYSTHSFAGPLTTGALDSLLGSVDGSEMRLGCQQSRLVVSSCDERVLASIEAASRSRKRKRTLAPGAVSDGEHGEHGEHGDEDAPQPLRRALRQISSAFRSSGRVTGQRPPSTAAAADKMNAAERIEHAVGRMTAAGGQTLLLRSALLLPPRAAPSATPRPTPPVLELHIAGGIGISMSQLRQAVGERAWRSGLVKAGPPADSHSGEELVLQVELPMRERIATDAAIGA